MEVPALGTFVDSFETIITGDHTQLDENGDILFIFKKNAIPQNLADLAWNTFYKVANQKNDNRGLAAGLLPNGNAKQADKYGVTRGNVCRSNIVGFFDKPIIQDKKLFPGKSVCRLTAYNHKNPELFEKTIPFFQCINQVYKENAPVKWHAQYDRSRENHPELLINDTVFSTVTCNYNWRTACHVDNGDFINGLGNLTVVGRPGAPPHTGGIIGFPKYNMGVDVQPRDVLLMNVHQVHGNTEITSGDRLSFVCYLRNGMHKCKYKVDGTKFFTSL